MTGPEHSGSDRPPLRVVRGDATPEEIAALVAVLAAAGGGAELEGGVPQPSRWATSAGRVRPAVPHGPGAWRGSALPH